MSIISLGFRPDPAAEKAKQHRDRTERELREKLMKFGGFLSDSQAAFIAKSMVRDYVIVARA